MIALGEAYTGVFTVRWMARIGESNGDAHANMLDIIELGFTLARPRQSREGRTRPLLADAALGCICAANNQLERRSLQRTLINPTRLLARSSRGIQIGGRAAGSCTAALFLKSFVNGVEPSEAGEGDAPSVRWAHLDIAGTMEVRYTHARPGTVMLIDMSEYSG